MEVKATGRGLIEININPHLQEDDSTTRPVEELTRYRWTPMNLAVLLKLAKD